MRRAAAALDRAAGQPLSEHPDTFAEVHRELQQALADIDDA